MKPFNSLTFRGKIGNLIYQKTAPVFANVPGDTTGTLQVRTYNPINTSNTPAQQINRARFALAVAAFRLADAATLAAFKERGAKHGLTAYNAFISDWLRNN